MKTGIWLLQLGTPDDSSVGAARRFLIEFLSDPRVIDIPALFRFLLVYGIIAPFRSPKTAEAYQSIWMKDGSPLAVYSRALATELQNILKDRAEVKLSMRYQNPSLEKGWNEWKVSNPEKLIIVPLYPQYASATTGSTLEKVFKILEKEENIPALQIVPPFYDAAFFLDAWAAIARENQILDYEHILFSFHGIPERQVKKTDPTGAHCLEKSDCCAEKNLANRFCYRHHCLQTAAGIAKRLGLSADRYSISFQSRLGRTPWLKPFTDIVVPELPARGIRSLAVFSPSFVADCLETLEELDIRLKTSFISAGGKKFKLIPSLNAHPLWVQGLANHLSQWITAPK